MWLLPCNAQRARTLPFSVLLTTPSQKQPRSTDLNDLFDEGTVGGHAGLLQHADVRTQPDEQRELGPLAHLITGLQQGATQVKSTIQHVWYLLQFTELQLNSYAIVFQK